MNNRILLVDDDKDLCKLVAKYLSLDWYETTVCYNGQEGIKLALGGDYLLVVLDIMLPEINGLEVLSELRKQSAVPVLMLTAKDSEGDKVAGLRMGADDYLTKPFSQSEFLARVASLIRRYTVLNASLTSRDNEIAAGNLVINKEKRTVKAAGEEVELTAKEFDLLYFMASHKGRVFTKKQIYTAVLEEEYAFDDNNIMVHIRRLRKKIEPNPEAPVYILTVWGVGYKFGGDA